jgi:ATP-binding cassette subfamily F protein 3
MIQLQEISKSFGQRVLFSEVNIVLGPKERVGLVGRNGMGKSTLFKIIQGEENADGGQIAIPKGYSLGSLEQHLDFSGETILAEVVQALPKDLIYDHWRAEKILFGLGFTQEDLDRAPSEFSGGYQIRVKLAKVLVSAPNLLLLDEPTNYLDIVSLRWLSQFLKDFDGEVLVITHDRAFMDDVCTHIMGIHRKRVKKVRGNTKKYYEQLEADEEIYEQTRLNQERKRKELEGFIEKFSAKASKARQANSKKKIIEKMDEIDVLEEIADLRFSFNYEDIPSKFPFEAKSLSFGYGDGEDLFSDLSFPVGKGDCVGIIGKNGKGKSTLLNAIAGELELRSGSLWKAPGTLEGHFGQTNIERLHPTNTVVQEILGSNDELSITAVRGICGSMMFSGDDAEKPVSVLSGGEKARVMLGKILAKKTNLLYLDEPTNHLDLESIEILCEEIGKFKGCVFLVTHSELLLSRLVNKLVIFRKGKARFFDGNYKDFLEKIGWDDELPSKPKKDKVLDKRSTTKEKQSSNDHKVSEIEEEIIKLEEMISKFENLCQQKSAEGADITDISKTLSKLHEKVELKFQELEEFS